MRTEVKRKADSEKLNLSVDVGVGVRLSSFGYCCSSAYRVTLVNTDKPTRSRMEARISYENEPVCWCGIAGFRLIVFVHAVLVCISLLL